MRKEEQPIVEPVAFLVANAMIPREPVKAKGWSNEPFPAFYPADREADAKEAARILRAVCEPLYPASTIEALQAEIERLRERNEHLADKLREETAIVERIWKLFGDPSYEDLAGRSIYDLIHATQSEASALRKRVEELEEALGDLLTWFPDQPSKPEWRIEAGEYGADEAIAHARTLTEGGKNG